MTESTRTPLTDDELLAGVPVVAGFKYLEPCLLFREVGAGTFGKVYQARHLRYEFPFDCAVKCLKGGHELGRFRREATIGARLSHPNLVRVHGLHRFGHLHYLVMEWVDGETVAARMHDLRARANHGRIDPAEAVEIVRQAALGVAALHAEGVYHRDIKPANLMIRVDGVVKVADLGIAKATSPDGVELTELGQGFGTPGYMPLEQYEGADGAQAPADVFALGAVLYRMLTGRAGLPGNQMQSYAQLEDGGFPRLADSDVELPAGLAEVVDACTLTDPAERLADAAALVARLEALDLPRAALEFSDDERATLVVGGTTDGPTKAAIEEATRIVESTPAIAAPPAVAGIEIGGTEIVAAGGTAKPSAPTAPARHRGVRIGAAALGVVAIGLAFLLIGGDDDPRDTDAPASRTNGGAAANTSPNLGANGSGGVTADGPANPAVDEGGPTNGEQGTRASGDQAASAPSAAPESGSLASGPPTSGPPTLALQGASERRASLTGFADSAAIELAGSTAAGATHVLVEIDGRAPVEVPVGGGGRFAHAFELGAGTHDVLLTPRGASGQLGSSSTLRVQVDPPQDLLPGLERFALADLGGDPGAGERVGYRPRWRADMNEPVLASMAFVDVDADEALPLFALTEWTWERQRALIAMTDRAAFGPNGGAEHDALPARSISIASAANIVARLNELLPDAAPIEFIVPTVDEWLAFESANGAGATEVGHVEPTENSELAPSGNNPAGSRPVTPGTAPTGAEAQGPVTWEGAPTCRALRFPQGATRIRGLAGNVREICFADDEARARVLAGAEPEGGVALGSHFGSGTSGDRREQRPRKANSLDDTVGLRIAVRIRE